MGKKLIIAEKPSVGRDIAQVLEDTFKPGKDRSYLEGEKYIISWAIGHLVGLSSPDRYDKKYKQWNLADLPIIPKTFKLSANNSDAKKQLMRIKELLNRDDVTEVVNACDAGREGELIFAYIYQVCKTKKPVKRLWLSSMTAKAIKEAFDNLRDGASMKSLEDAARSRSEADWLVGMNATRAASVKMRGAFEGAVSLGRVQTPTLAMIVKREIEIQEFVPEAYWIVNGQFVLDPDENGLERKYLGKYLGGKKISQEEAEKIVSETHGKRGIVNQLEKKETTEQPELLYDLTTLQRHANTKFGYSATKTLELAQRLYEYHKALTYPRTSSRYLPSDMKDEIKEVARAAGGNGRYKDAAQYVMDLENLPTKRVIDDKKVDDHHAIIPTKETPNLRLMELEERRIYDLVTKRFLAIFYPDATWEKTKVETTVEGHVFRTSGRVLVSAGWREVYGAEDLEDKKEKDDENQSLPPIKQGEMSLAKKVKLFEKATKPPRRFNESSLLGAMETAGKDIEDEALREAMKESGIGTPATRASIIERLIKVGYIQRDGKSLVATKKGIDVINHLDNHPITSPELTGSWESRLSKIEHGTEAREKFMHDIATFSHQIVDALGKIVVVKVGLGPCPNCGKPVLENRKAFGCWTPEDPGCGFTIWKEKAGNEIDAAAAKELMENKKTLEEVKGFREGPGKKGKHFASRLELVQKENGKWAVEFEDKDLEAKTNTRPERATLGPCPVCKRPVRENAKAYGCWSPDDPGCGFVIWKDKLGFQITIDIAKELMANKKTAQKYPFKKKDGTPFEAKMVLAKNTEGKWQIEFDFDNHVAIADT